MEFSSSYCHTFGNPDFKVGFSGGGTQNHRPCPVLPPSGDVVMQGASGRASRAPSMFYVPDVDVEETHQFLDVCSLCRKALSGDIFMYRGDTAFCSEECRREQIEMDKVKYRKRKQPAQNERPQQQAKPHN